jgi:hypothetical protein
MNGSITNEQAFSHHKTTGCPFGKAKLVLANMKPLLRARVLEAARTQSHHSTIRWRMTQPFRKS